MWESENQDESPLMTTDNFHGIDRLVKLVQSRGLEIGTGKVRAASGCNNSRQLKPGDGYSVLEFDRSEHYRPRSSSDHRLGGGADYEFNSLPGHEERSSVLVVASGANCIDEDRIETPIGELLNCSGRRKAPAMSNWRSIRFGAIVRSRRIRVKPRQLSDGRHAELVKPVRNLTRRRHAHDDNSSSRALASFRSRVSKPSVNQP